MVDGRLVVAGPFTSAPGYGPADPISRVWGRPNARYQTPGPQTRTDEAAQPRRPRAGTGRTIYGMTCARHLGRALATLCVAAISTDARAQQGLAPRCGTGVHEFEALGTVLFPADWLDCPVLAHPRNRERS